MVANFALGLEVLETSRFALLLFTNDSGDSIADPEVSASFAI